jgi:hypothetical protein
MCVSLFRQMSRKGHTSDDEEEMQTLVGGSRSPAEPVTLHTHASSSSHSRRFRMITCRSFASYAVFIFLLVFFVRTMISPLVHPPLPSNTNARGTPHLRLPDAMRQLEAVAGADNVGSYGGAYMFEQSSNALDLIAQMLHGVDPSPSSSPVTVCETGFEIGHSALAFLHASPSTRVVSFDMMDTKYKKDCEVWLQETYGKDRIQVIPGNTADSVPQYLKENPQLQCGVVFPDEGHDWRDEVRTAKLFHPHATCQTIIILDWGSDVSVLSSGVVNSERDQRWTLLEEEGIIREIGCFSGRKTFTSDHRWWNRLNTQIQFCVGRYRSIKGKECDDL